MSKIPSSAGAAAGASDEKLAPTVGAPLEDVKQKGPATIGVNVIGAADNAGSGAAAAKGKQPLSSSDDEEYVPRTKRGHWSDVDPFGSWPAYDNYDDIKQIDSDDVDSDDDSRNDKRRHVLAKLERGDYTYQHGENNFSCPFCERKIGTNFDNVVMHAEALGSCNARLGESVNKTAFIAKHAAFGVHLRKIRAMAIELGVVQPPKGQGSKKKKSIEQCLSKCSKCRCLMVN